MQVSVGARTRSALLLASALGCSLSVFVTAAPALAAAVPVGNDCGPVVVNGSVGSVTCTATSGTGNSYPNGITYTATQPVDLTVVLQGGTAGAVNVNATGTGVSVTGYAGNSVTVKSYAGASVTAGHDGIDAMAAGGGAGAASINNAGTVSAVTRGLWAFTGSSTGDASVTNTGAITIGAGATNYAVGIVAGRAGGAASATNSGAITVNTGATLAAGIYTAAQGAQTINNNAGGTVSVTGAGKVIGLATYAVSAATATINNAAAITVASTGATGSAFGIQSDNNQTVTVDLTGAGSVTATGYSATGLHVLASGAVTVTGAAGTTISANGSGGSGDGVYANSTGGIATVNVDGVSTTGVNTFGVTVNGHYGAYVDVGHVANGKTYGVVTTGANSVGVSVYSLNGPVTVTNHGSVQTSGANSPGVSGISYAGTATVANAAGAVIHTQGDGSLGAYASSTSGSATINNAGTIVTEGNKATAVAVETFGGIGGGLLDRPAGVQGQVAWSTATIVNTGTITTSGAYSDGAYAMSSRGSAVITSTAVTTSGANAVGLLASGKYAATVTTGAVTTHGAGADGVSALALAPTPNSYTTVHITGPIVTTGANARGVVAGGGYSVTVDGSGAVTTTGANAPGIEVTGQHITVNVTGAVSATGAGSTGVGTFAEYGSSVTVGKVTANAAAVFSQTKYGAATTAINGAVVSAKNMGAIASSMEGAAAVTVAQGGSVSGATAGVLAAGYTGATVTNHGVITSTSGFAVSASSPTGAAAIVNAADGVITGAVSVNGATGSTFTNAGVWNASGASTFGAAAVPPADRVGGAARATAPAAPVIIVSTGTTNVAAGTVTLSGASAFDNSGLIDMRNGHVGDVFDLGGATFNATGSSQLAVEVDAAPGAAKADKLVVGAASGTTTVLVQDVTNGGGGGFNVAGLTVAQAASGTPSSAFVLGTARNGFVDYTLSFDPTATTWSLFGLPGHAVFETLKLPQLSQAFAQRSDDVWFQRMQEVRDASAAGARKDGFEFWGQVYGGGQNVGQSRTFNLSGASFSENLGARSRWGGVQFGVDHVSAWRSGRLLWGFTAGYLDQWSQFNTGSTATGSFGQSSETGRARDSLELKGANLGGYVGYTQGGWFLNGLAKVDFGGANLNLNSVQLRAATNATVWGVNGELGYRFGGAGLFVEPVVRLSGGDTNVDRFTGLGASVAYPDATNLLTTVGARFGGRVQAGQVTLSPWLGAYVADELLGENRMGFTLGGTTLDLRDQAVRSFARIDGGVTASAPFGAQGFLKAGADTGSGVTGWTANFGVRWRW